MRTCPQCGKSYEVSPQDVRRGRGAYCGRECYHASRPGVPRGPYKWTDPSFNRPQERVCPVCDTKFLVGGQGNPSRTTTFCSKNCRYAARQRKCGKLCNRLTEAQSAYIAGIVDGEGSVMLIVRTSVRLPSVHLRVSVSNTCFKLLEWLRVVTGIGTVHLVDNQKYGRSTRQGGVWKTHGESAASFLEQILPYLIIKPNQATGGIKFQKRLRDPRLKADRGWQMEWLLRMKKLNARGVKPQE
jgi:hypothetical protein